jgi:adenine deaminase
MNTTANQTEISEATRARAVRAAQGLEPFDLLLTGAEIVDVITGEVRAADVGLVGNMIASVHERDACSNALATHNLSGKTLVPGFIDSHVHIESSHLLPEHYAAAVIPQGTTTIYYDPHELANVLGIEGVRYAIEATRRLPLRCLCQASSSVPSAPGLEVAGASIGANEMRTMLSWPEVVGVAEMMDMKGVLNASDRMATIAAEARLAGKVMEGHARSLAGAPLQAYLAAGVATDHELTSGADFIEKLRAGLTIQIRGSHDYVLPQIVEELNKLPHVSSQITVCTDDVPPDQLLANGGVADLLRRFIAYGARPADAYRFATLNAALHLNRRDLGAIAAGRIADLVVLTNLCMQAANLQPATANLRKPLLPALPLIRSTLSSSNPLHLMPSALP